MRRVGWLILLVLSGLLLVQLARWAPRRVAPAALAPERGAMPAPGARTAGAAAPVRESPAREEPAATTRDPASADPARPEGSEVGLCVEVTRAQEPLGRASVRLWLAEAVPLRTEVGVRAPAERSTDERGACQFPALAPGDYFLRVDAPDGGHRAGVVAFHEPLRRVRVEFGTACLAGEVRYPGGGPAAGIRVRLAGLGSAGELRVAHAWTDAAGEFELCALPAAVYWVVPEGLVAGRADALWRVELAGGQRRRVRLGALASDPRWRGRVVDGDGRAVDGLQVLVEDLASGLRWAAAPRDDGGFECVLAPGRYRFGLVLPRMSLLDAGLPCAELSLGAGDVQQDLVIPGACVHLRFLLDGAPVPLEAQAFRLLLPDGSMRVADASAGEELSFLALPPGAYRLESTGPFQLEAGRELRFTIPGPARSLALEVALLAR